MVCLYFAAGKRSVLLICMHRTKTKSSRLRVSRRLKGFDTAGFDYTHSNEDFSLFFSRNNNLNEYFTKDRNIGSFLLQHECVLASNVMILLMSVYLLKRQSSLILYYSVKGKASSIFRQDKICISL